MVFDILRCKSCNFNMTNMYTRGKSILSVVKYTKKLSITLCSISNIKFDREAYCIKLSLQSFFGNFVVFVFYS
jgi:hypothetical protein